MNCVGQQRGGAFHAGARSTTPPRKRHHADYTCKELYQFAIELLIRMQSYYNLASIATNVVTLLT